MGNETRTSWTRGKNSVREVMTMITAVTPNKAIVFAVGAFILYWVMAFIFPIVILRDVFNSLAFGTAVVITATWAPSTYRAIKEEANSGAWQLILGISLFWFVVLIQRIYAIAFNWAGRPPEWLNHPISGFFAYSFMISGLLFLSAPGVRAERELKQRALVAMVVSVAIGGFIAGVLFGTSIASD